LKVTNIKEEEAETLKKREEKGERY